MLFIYPGAAASEEVLGKLPGAIALHASGENIFAARCEVERLNRLGLVASEAVKWNDAGPHARKIKGKEALHVIDFATSKVQALHGLSGQGAEVYWILNYQKAPLYFRAEGGKAALEKMGIKIPDLIKADDTLSAEKKIQMTSGRMNVAEEIANGRQMLIGLSRDKKMST